MKLKGINPFEQYVDKALFGLVGVSLLGVLAWQFVGPGNQIDVAGAKVDPDKAYNPVKTQAIAIQAKVNSQAPELPAPPRADVLKRFEDRLTKGVAPSKNIVALAPSLTLGGGAAEFASTADAPIAPLVVPAPTGVTGATFANAISPMEVVANEDLAKLLPAEQPFDKQAVSVEAEFDGTALARSLESRPEGDARTIPLGWWRGQMSVIAVEMERERQLSSGEWGEATQVPTMPGRVNLLKDLDKRVKSKGDLPMLISSADQSQDFIQRPAYYDIVAGPEWRAPTEASTGETKTEKIDRLQKQINDLQKEEESLKRRFEKLNNQASAPSGGGHGEEGPSGGPRGGPGGRGAPPPPPPSNRDREKKERPGQKEKKSPLETKIEEIGNRIVKAKADLEKLNAPEQQASNDADKRLALLENPKVRVWAHDITAEPGATYRYRLRIVTNNPLYGQKLVEAQKADAASPIVRGAWSDWTDPITVEAKEYYFITGASPGDDIGGARASAELYKFYYGFWRKGSAVLEPGDVPASEAKLPDGLRLWDMEKLKAGAKPKITLANPGGGGGEREQPGAEHGGGPGRHQLVDEGSERGRVPTEPGEKPKLDDDGLSKPAPKTIDFFVDAMMLDTSTLPSSGGLGGKSRFRTFFRDHSGQIVVRYPDVDASSDLYKRLAANAKMGESQGRPQVKPVNPQDAPPPNPGRPRPAPEEGKPSGG